MIKKIVVPIYGYFNHYIDTLAVISAEGDNSLIAHSKQGLCFPNEDWSRTNIVRNGYISYPHTEKVLHRRVSNALALKDLTK